MILLCVIFAQAVGSAARTSMTIDEGLHITSGYTILRTGDYRLVEEHPPLVKLLQAVPLLPVPDLAEPTTLPEWESDIAATDSVRLVRATQGIEDLRAPVALFTFQSGRVAPSIPVFAG